MQDQDPVLDPALAAQIDQAMHDALSQAQPGLVETLANLVALGQSDAEIEAALGDLRATMNLTDACMLAVAHLRRTQPPAPAPENG